MEDYELTLFDRLEVIKQVNKEHDLEKNGYISFSGGKDSTILHYLIDMALPNNNIPRLYIDTGIEYQYIRDFVLELAKNDKRIQVIKPNLPIKSTLEKYGYPIKSKQHSHNLAIYQHSKKYTQSVKRYLGIIESNTLFRCPTQLTYQFTKDFKINISEKCCLKMKKEPVHKWEKENNRIISLTGMRKDEGGQRKSIKGCIITDKDKKVIKFHPLLVVSDNFENWFIEKNNIKLCKLYYPPFNFKRTGCKGCPFSLELQEQLTTMENYLPSERKACEIIWKPIYEEYRRIGYRLDKVEQLKLF